MYFLKQCILPSNGLFTWQSRLKDKGYSSKQYGPLRGYDRDKKILHFFGITVCRRQRSLRKLHTHSQSFGSLTRVVYSCYTLACDELGLLWCFILTSSVHHVCYLKSSFTVPELYSVRCVLLSKAPLPFPFQSTNWHTAPMTLIDVNILCFSAPRWQ